jgi:general secretion pathway protein H
VLEILVVIALMGLLSGVLITGGIHLAREKAITPEDVFWKSVLECRRVALLSGREVRLTYSGKSEKERAFLARGPDGSELRFPIETPGPLTVDFLSAQKSGNTILLAGQLVETKNLSYVTFYGDGTCSPFRLQIRATGEARVLSIDPWTCTLVLTGEEERR